MVETDRLIEKKRLDQYKQFLDPTLADNQDAFYGPIRPLIGPELSVAILEREDIPGYIKIGHCVQEMFSNGQDDIGLLLMTGMIGELKLTMSIGGNVVGNIFSNKMEYSQTQTVHEYQHPVAERKKGLFGFGKSQVR